MREIFDKEFRPCGFWIRLCAFILDRILLLAVDISVLLTIFAIVNVEAVKYNFFSKEAIFTYVVTNNFSIPLTCIATVFLIESWYYTFWHAYRGQTIGKILMNIKVIPSKDKTSTITYKQAFLRYLTYHSAVFSLGIGFFIIGLNKNKRGLHDLLAKTYVIYSPS